MATKFAVDGLGGTNFGGTIGGVTGHRLSLSFNRGGLAPVILNLGT